MELGRQRPHLFVRSTSKSLAAVRGGMSHSQEHGLGPSTRGYAGLKQDSPDDVSVNLVSAGDGLLGFPSGVERDNLIDGHNSPPTVPSQFFGNDAERSRVVSVRRSFYSGHVYTLHTSSGLYAANGVVVRNCRCAMATQLEEPEWMR
jgi:hypothetical protein